MICLKVSLLKNLIFSRDILLFLCRRRYRKLILAPKASVVDPHFSTYYPHADSDAEPDSDFFYLMRIRIQILASKKGSNP